MTDEIKALPMDSAPKNNTLVRLLVDYAGEGEHPLEDAEQAWTIGFNNFEDSEIDEWQFAGWSWSQDCFCEGQGRVIGWAPFHQDDRLHDAAAPMADGGDTPMTAAEEVLVWLLVEKIGVPDDVSYSPDQAQEIISDRLAQIPSPQTNLRPFADGIREISDVFLLEQLDRDNIAGGARPVIESHGWDQARRLSDAGLIAIESVGLGGRLHITRKGMKAVAAFKRGEIEPSPQNQGEAS